MEAASRQRKTGLSAGGMGESIKKPMTDDSRRENESATELTEASQKASLS